MATNGRNLSKITKNMNAAGEFTSEAFSDTLLAASGPVLYDSDADVPIDGVALGSQAFVPSEGYLVRLTDEAWWVVNEAVPVIPWTYQGKTAGYMAHGYSQPKVVKYLYGSEVPTTVHGDLTAPTGYYGGGNGSSSQTHGYSTSGSVIYKFSMVNEFTQSSVDVLPLAVGMPVEHQSETNGYSGGGQGGGFQSTIHKFPFAADNTAGLIGNLTRTTYSSSAQNSGTHAYTSAGYDGSVQNHIDKFPFATDANATVVGTLSRAFYASSGVSSQTNGYTLGGYQPSLYVNPAITGTNGKIDKFPFASDANGTEIGDLASAGYWGTSSSSTTKGYTAGGREGWIYRINIMDFASETSSVSGGYITHGASGGRGSGHQV
jgi:hypothetical protein